MNERRSKKVPIPHPERRRTMAENGITKVRFDLWAVLAFLVILVGGGGIYMFNAQAADREKLQSVKEEVIVLKQQYVSINEKLCEISATLKEFTISFERYRYNTEKKKPNNN